jgi:hypothetical protein
MKPQAHRIEDAEHGLLEADLAASIRMLFRRRPRLCGFSVISAPDGRLGIAEVSVYPWSALGAPGELRDDIMGTLFELIEERPGTRELLGGRTFARVFH